MCAYSKQMGFGQLHQRVLFCAKNTCFVVVVVVAFLQPLLSYGLVGDGWECLWISVGHCEFLSQFVHLLVAAHAYGPTHSFLVSLPQPFPVFGFVFTLVFSCP